MDKQQALRRKVVGASSSCADNQAQKSLAAQPRTAAPHRILDLRNRITAGGPGKAPAGGTAKPSKPAPRREDLSPPRGQ